jgi:hypothetical protein
MLLNVLMEKSKEKLKGANIYLQEEGKSQGYELSVGNNFKWISQADEEEQAVEITEDTLKVLDYFKVQYPDSLKKFASEGMPKDDMCIEIELKDNSGTYSTCVYEGNLDIMGLNTTSVWIDFNNLTKEN